MPSIKLLIKELNDQRYLCLLFEYDKNLVNQLQQLGCSLHFSGSVKYMRIGMGKAVEVIRKLKALQFSLDTTELPNALWKNADMSEEMTETLMEYHAFLRGQRYSGGTVKAYYSWMLEFLYFNKGKNICEFNVDDIHRFNSRFVVKRNYSVSSQRQFIGAAKLFFSFVVKCDIVPEELQRPRREKKLPIVLSKENIRQILRHTTNLKHKAILSLIYSSGLRISELVNLKLIDIDKARMLIHIRLAKGKKDRYVPLSKACLLILRAYYRKYRPKKLLFEGHYQRPYSATSIRKILRRACKLSGIKKVVTPHTLRHSYATHMLEMGVDIRYIQTLLGHSRPETTMIYTHVRSQKIDDLINPLDELVKEDLSQSDILHKFPQKSSLIPPNSWGF